MALQKTQNFKEIDLTYHSIISYTYSKVENRTFVQIGIYKDQKSSDDNVGNYISQYQTSFSGGDYALTDLYSKIKESVKIGQLDKAAVPAVIVNGIETVPAVPATYKQVETNFYVDALNV